MKRKSLLFGFIVFMFGLCGTISFFDFQTTQGSSLSASVWDGTYVTDLNDLTDADYKVEGDNIIAIYSAKGFSYFASQVNKAPTSKVTNYNTYLGTIISLKTDIDLNGKNWLPIGGINSNSQVQSFQGEFDGGNHYIYNMKIDSSFTSSSSMIGFNSGYVGLFGAVSDRGRVKNLNLRNVDIQVAAADAAAVSIGGVVGSLQVTSDRYQNSTYIENCSVTGSISLTGSPNATCNVGGVVGYVEKASVSNALSNASISIIANYDPNENFQNFKIGGIAGNALGAKFNTCANEGDITSNVGGQIGGIVGAINGVLSNGSIITSSISSAYNIGKIKLTSEKSGNLGGIAGFAGSQSGNAYFSLNLAYNAGDITTTNIQVNLNVYGLVGNILTSSMVTNISLSNAFSIGEVKTGTTVITALYTSNETESLENVTTKLYGQNDITNLKDFAKTREFYRNYEYWGATSPWIFGNSGWTISVSLNGGLPYLTSLYNLGNANNDKDYSNPETTIPFKGEGTQKNPYLIETAADLGWLSFNYSFQETITNPETNVEKQISFTEKTYFSLKNNIDLSGKTWRPLGDAEKPFSGVFDGNNFTISGISCSLQEQFNYHAFIGVAENAVIKNLKISDISYITETESSENGANQTQMASASFIGLAKANVYLINCVDNSGIENLKTVYSVEGSLYAIYGQNNYNVFNEVVTSHLNLGTSGNIIFGYDITVDGDGGKFYDEDRNLYTDYHILVHKTENLPSNERLINPVDLKDNLIDETYGKSMLPRFSNSLGEQDVLMKEGYYLSKYIYNFSKSEVSQVNEKTSMQNQEVWLGNSTLENFESNKWLSGIKAVWVKKEVQINIIYNAYETVAFKPLSMGSDETIAYKSEIFRTDYDTILQNKSEIFSAPSTVLREGFVLEGLYGSFDANKGFSSAFTYKIEKDGSDLVNWALPNFVIKEKDGTLGFTLYAKWQANDTEENKRTFKVVFKKDENKDVFSNMFSFEDAIDSVSLIKRKPNGEGGMTEETIKGTLVNLLDQNNNTIGAEFIFTFENAYSLSKEENLSIVIKLKNGYISAGSSSTSGKTNDLSSFGALTMSDNSNTLAGVPLSAFDENMRIYNFLPESGFSINFTISRQNNEWKTNISDDVYFALTPNLDGKDNGGNVTKKAISSVSFCNFNSASNPFDIYRENLNNIYAIGYDFLHNKVLSDRSAYDDDLGALGDNYVYTNGNVKKVIMKWTFEDGTSQYFLYEWTTTDEFSKIALYKIATEKDAENNDIIIWNDATTFMPKLEEHLVEYYQKLNAADNTPTINYFALSSFKILASTENDEVYLNKYYANENNCNILLYPKPDETSSIPTDKPTKILYTFNKLGPDVTKYTFSLVTRYSKALFEFEYYYGNERLTTNAPASMSNKFEDVSESGTISFDIPSSNFYKFKLGDDVSLYELDKNGLLKTDFNIKIEVSDAYLGEKASEQDKADFENGFNNDNTSYFTNASATLHKKDKETYKEDTYTVSLDFKGLNAGTDALKIYPGHYLVKLDFTDVQYSADASIKFISNDAEDFSDDAESGITVSGTHKDTTGVSFSDILYDDALSFETMLGENKGYDFYGWYINGEYLKNGNEINSQTVLNMDKYSNYNNQDGKTGDDRFNMSVFAVYKRKLLTIEKHNQLLLLDNLGSGENINITSNSSLSANLYRNYSTVDSKDALQYYFNSMKDETGTALQNLSFTLNGTNSNGYYMVGYALSTSKEYISDSNIVLDVDGNKIQDYDNNSIDLYLSLHALLNSGALPSKTTYYLVPVIRQKTIEVSVHSGSTEEYNYSHNETFVKGKIGTVYNSEYVETTENVLTKTYYYSQIVDLSVANSELFEFRKGYKTGDIFGNYWGYVLDSEINTNYSNSFSLESKLFTQKQLDKDTTTNEIHLFKLWSPQSYRITFEPNGGSFNDNVLTKSVEIVFDSSKTSGTIPNENDIAKSGYKLVGFYLNDEQIYDNFGEHIKNDAGQIIANSLFDINGDYINPNNVTLKAVWEEKPYQVMLNFNGANGETQQASYEIDYNSTFANLKDKNGTIVNLKDIAPSRSGFIFDGFYIVGDSVYQVSDTTIFTETLPTFSHSKEFALTLYAKWRFDPTSIFLSIVDNTLGNLTYNATEQTLYLADYFTTGNFTVKGLEISVNEKTLTISALQEMGLKTSLELSSASGAIVFKNDLSYQVRNAGNYSVDLTIKLQDTTGISALQQGTVYSQNLSFFVSVDKADLQIETANNDNLKLNNARRIIRNFLPSTGAFSKRVVDELTTLSAFSSLIKAQDETSATATDDDIYRFVMTKYYLLLSTTNVETLDIYRNWNYQDFETYKLENSTSVDAIISNLQFFDFYNHENTNAQEINKDFYTFKLVSNGNPVSEVNVSSYLIYSNDNLVPFSSYELRVILENANENLKVLGNYNLNLANDDIGYLTVGNAYILPQMLEISNTDETNYSYFESGMRKKEINWSKTISSTITYNGQVLYDVGNGLYVKAKLFTSNLGSEIEDKVFDAFDSENYLYFDEITVVKKTNSNGQENFEDVTSRFKLMLKEDQTYTILKTSDLVNLTLTSKYLTIDETGLSVLNMPESIASGLLKVSKLVYSLEGTETTVENFNEGLYTTNSSSGGTVRVFELIKNNANQISILSTNLVKEITFSYTQRTLGVYLEFSKWSAGNLDTVEDIPEKDNSVTFKFDYSEDRFKITVDKGGDFVQSEFGLTDLEYFATWTDLVPVHYETNLPEDYEVANVEKSALKLGSSTAQDLSIPNAKGLTLSTLMVKDQSGNFLDYTNLFEGGVFEGYSSSNPHQAITLYAKWEIESIKGYQDLTQKQMSVQTFTGLTVDQVFTILNLNTDIADYSYEWLFGDTIVSKGQSLTLKGNGSADESGTYTLKITETLKSKYRSALVDPTNYTTTKSVDFDLEFMRLKIVSVTAPSETSSTYNFREQSLSVTISYQVFDNNTASYGEPYDLQIMKGSNGAVNFKLKLGGVETTSFKNAGLYDIDVVFDTSYYDTSELSSNIFNFSYQILPAKIELSEMTASKNFNSNDPTSFTKSQFLTNNELSTLVYTRQAGEDVGTYDMFFSDVLQVVKTNYIFTYKGVEIFKDGELTEIGKTTKVGTFEIKQSGSLVISYDTSLGAPKNLVADYDPKGYSLSKIENGTANILNGDEIYKTLNIKLYDQTKGAYLTDSEAYDLVLNALSTLDFKFYYGAEYDSIVNSQTYTYFVSKSTVFSKYYFAVEFDKSFTFTIETTKIDVDNFSSSSFEKTYDGTNKIYLTPKGEKISDLSVHDGAYIDVTLSSAHVGENLTATLTLKSTKENEILSNYSLSENTIDTAKISKLEAKLEVKLKNSTLDYGQFKISNLQSVIDGFTLKASGVDVKVLAVDGYYNVEYLISNADGSEVSTSPSGCLYAGDYKINATANFNDFDVTVVNAPTIVVSPITVIKTLYNGYLTIALSDVVQASYEDVFTIPNSNDIVTLNYVTTFTAGEKPSAAGSFALSLSETQFCQGSVTVKLENASKAFTVLPATEVLFVKIDDTRFFEQTYNGKDFQITAADLNLNISNAGSSTLSFYTRTDTGEETVNVAAADFTSFKIKFNQNDSVKKAGSYRLTVTVEISNTGTLYGNYSVVAFYEDYTFKINKKTIDIADLDNIEKTYDGKPDTTVLLGANVFDGDDVSLLARFENATAGENKAVRLFLQGVDFGNYELSASTTTGKINKAQATVTLSANTFVFGQINSTKAVAYTVVSNGKNVYESDYNLTLEITSKDGTALGFSSNGYLNAGEYSVSLQVYSSTNYTLSLAETQITVSPLEIVLALTEDGRFEFQFNSAQALSDKFDYQTVTTLGETVTLTLTRESGNTVDEFYHVTGGSLGDANYTLNVSDTSANGAVKIVKAKDVVYMLSSEKVEVSSDENLEISFEYDGNLYDTAALEYDLSRNKYTLVLTSSTNSAAKKSFDLNPYTFDGTKYTLSDLNLENLTASIYFQTFGKNVGTYNLFANNSVSSTTEVRLGKAYAEYAFTIKVLQKQIYLKEGTIDNLTLKVDENTGKTIFIKTFDNKFAEFSFENVDNFLNGSIATDILGMNLKFLDKDDETLAAKFVDTNYHISCALTGESAANYNLNLKTSESGDEVTGVIDFASLTIVVDSQTFVYGTDIVLEYRYETDVDLDGYNTGSINIKIEPNVSQFSSTGFVPANPSGYTMKMTFNSSDFGISKFVVNNTNYDQSTIPEEAKVFVEKKELSISASTTSLSTIFTKVYDASNVAYIKNNEGTLKFNLNGVVATESNADDVTISSAQYASANVGNGIQVNFDLSGNDKDNYILEPYLSGNITPVIVKLKFNYDKSILQSDTESSGFKELSKLSFPFIASTLTGNSADNATNGDKNFPKMLTPKGEFGKEFTYWTMDFENIENGDAKYTFLEKVVSENRMTKFYDAATKIYSIQVANDAKTVELLSALINDDSNLFGLSYKNSDNDLTVTFNPNWKDRIFNVRVNIEGLGSVTLVEDGNYLIESAYSKDFAYDTKLTFKALAGEHCLFDGFYENGTILSSNENIRIYQSTEDGKTYNILELKNLRKNFALQVKFSSQKIDIVYNLNETENITVPSNFVYENGKYIWKTDYVQVKDLLLNDVTFKKLGFDLTKLDFVSSSEGSGDFFGSIEANDFATKHLIDLIGLTQENSITLTLTPTFVAKGIKVNLNYNYSSLTRTVYVPYLGQFKDCKDDDGKGWEETVEREGYSFKGWWTLNGVDSGEWGTQVTRESVMNELLEEFNLYAKWEILSYKLTLIAQNGTITSDDFDLIDGKYVAKNPIEFGSQISFVLSAKEGYHISTNADDWNSAFTFVDNLDGSYIVTVTMPAQDLEITLPIFANDNQVTIEGENISEILAFDITTEEHSIDVTDKKFVVLTGKKIRIEVFPVSGYKVTDSTVENGETLSIEKLVDQETGILLAVEIEGIFQDITLTFETRPSENVINVSFDEPERIEQVISGGSTFSNITDALPFSASTGSVLSFYVLTKHGYLLDEANFEAGDLKLTITKISNGDFEDYFLIEVDNIKSDADIVLKTVKENFTLTMKTVSYNENKIKVDVTGNKVLANGVELDEITLPFGTEVTLTYSNTDVSYRFAGWSKDETTILNSDAEWIYTITDNETIYAIFSKLKYEITFSTMNTYEVGTEYNDPSKVQKVTEKIVGRFYKEGENFVSSTVLYYGATKTIRYLVPNGYMFTGYGIKLADGTYKMIDNRQNSDREIDISIFSSALEDQSTNVELVIFVEAYNVKINLETKIDIDGMREEDINEVGYAVLQNENEEDVNAYGYLEGTRVHYDNFDPTLGEQSINHRNFSVYAFTGDRFFLRIETKRAGYKFSHLDANGQDVNFAFIKEEDDYIFYEVSNFVGGLDTLNIDILYKPHLNLINLSFTAKGITVDGGAFDFHIEDAYKKKIWTSGIEYTSMLVSAYTDSEFKVVAYIRAGFYVNEKDLEVLAEGTFSVENISYSSLSLIDTGYTGKISFTVKDYLGQENSIKIKLKTMKYTVKLKEEENTLAILKNVRYSSLLNLSENNSDNIEIVDERISYFNGKLNVVLQKINHNYEGFFTSQNGAGVQYINSEGNAINPWNESGYVLDNATSKYILAENAEINEETGEITLSLYIYWSYLKTRISFEFVPNVNIDFTAIDIVSGVDYTNSWYYSTSPLYIEVAFSTDIKLHAPSLEGYTFYKFVISQKNSEGTWLSDVTAYTNDLPWSTNEFDRIVECKIKVDYFAKVDVSVIGGEGKFRIVQETDDNQARVLLQQGYVDTSKPFSVEAVPNEGYKFVYWKNKNQISTDPVLTLSTSQSINLVMYLEGEVAILDFNDYDPAFGQILFLTVYQKNGNVNIINVGSFYGDEFRKTLLQTSADKNSRNCIKVGDVVEFTLSIEYGFGVVWNRSDIKFKEYYSNRYTFLFTILPEFAGQTIEIVPEFKDEVLSFYINRKFADDENLSYVLDLNNVDMAGAVLDAQGKKTDRITSAYGVDVLMNLQTNLRYTIRKITLKNYDSKFENLLDYVLENGNLIFTNEFLETNNIVGTVEIVVEYGRLLWEDVALQSTSFEGDGTSKNAYKIKSEEDLVLMMKFVNSGLKNDEELAYRDAYYILESDLNLEKYFWTPIGTQENPFNGTFNFNSHKISGVFNAYIHETVSYNGLFGILGASARFIENIENFWYVYLIVGLVVLMLVLLIVLLYFNRKNKKKREALATK